MNTKGLQHSVAIIVPSTKDGDSALSPEAFRQEMTQAVTFLAQRFGGATAIPGLGGWMSQGELITEDVWIVTSFLEKLSDTDTQAVIAYAAELKNRLNQEAVSVLFDGELFFVPKE